MRVTTDHHPAYHKAIRWIVGKKVMHRQKQYLNNRTEQDHRGIKQRYYPMLGFGSFASASRFCVAFDAVRQYFGDFYDGPVLVQAERIRHGKGLVQQDARAGLERCLREARVHVANVIRAADADQAAFLADALDQRAESQRWRTKFIHGDRKVDNPNKEI